MTTAPEASEIDRMRAEIAGLKGQNHSLSTSLRDAINENTGLYRMLAALGIKHGKMRSIAIMGWLAWLLMSIAWVLHFT